MTRAGSVSRRSGPCGEWQHTIVTRLAIVVLAAVLLGGCGLQLAPYNGRQSCQGVGGTYTSDGRCLAGSA